MAWLQVLIFAIVCLCGSYAEQSIQSPETKRHPDVGLRVPALVTKYGYPLESHYVQTKDDYILTLHRIRHGKNNADVGDRPVVFLMHGLLASSAGWVVMGPGHGLAYVLADMGYDVWMGNARGNTYSRKHLHWRPDFNAKFWDFSWHEIGTIDLPAMIDYVLSKTEQKDLYYIGHSQGTTSFFVMTSTLPEYNDKIRVMISFAPVAYMKNIRSYALQIISQFHTLAGWVGEMLGLSEFLPSSKFMQFISQVICNDDSIGLKLCSNVLFLILGSNQNGMDATMVPVILSNMPAGAATKQLLHYAQEIKSGYFAQYDYGLLKNMFKYRQIHPPTYKTSRISAPVVFLWGGNDLMTHEKDIRRLYEEIVHPVLMWKVKDPNFSHTDFLFSVDITKTLYPKVFDMLARF